MNSLRIILTTLVFGLLFSSCKLPKSGIGKDNSFDPVSVTVGDAGEDMPFLELTGSAAPSKSALQPEKSPYRLRPGDVLEVEVVGDPKTMARTVVLPDGMLYFDAADGVRAGGQTVAAVEAALAKQLSAIYSFPVISANLHDVQGNRYTVIGQVKTPGSYPLRQPTTLIDAIASAGGLASSNFGSKTTDLADLSRSALIRNGKMMPVNFRKLVEQGDMMHNVYMKPGDYVFLPAAGSEKVYVLGSVNRPTTMAYSSRVTLISAIAAARGVKKYAYTSGLVLIRGSFTEPKLARVNLRGIMTGKAKNFHLKPGDIVWVPKQPWSKLSEYGSVALSSVATSVALNEAYETFGTQQNNNDGAVDAGANNVEIQEEAEPEPEPEPEVFNDPEPVFEDPVIIDPDPVAL